MSKPNLRELQEGMQALLQREGSAHARCAGWIASPPHQDTVAARLDIYDNTHHLTLKEGLAGNYIGLRCIMGEEPFDDLAEAFIAATPSTVFSLDDYGEELAAFMQSQPAYQQQLAWIEMAQFEWALAKSLFAAEGAVLQREELAAIAPEAFADLCFEFHPSFQLLTLQSNVPDLWMAATREEPLPQLIIKDEALLWSIWRKLPDVYFAYFELPAAQTLQMLAAGKSFGETCELLAETIAEEAVPDVIGYLLQHLIAEGYLSQFHMLSVSA